MAFDTNKVKTYYDISKLILAQGDFVNTHLYIDSGLTASEQLHYTYGCGAGNFLHGYAYRKNSSLDSAILYFRKSIPFFKEYKSREALAYESLGASYDYYSKYDSALFYYEIGFEKAVVNKDTVQQMRIITNIGNLYYYKAKYKEACQNYLTALRIGEARKDSEVIAANYINVANMVGLLGDTKKAIEYSLKAIPICEAMGDFKKLGNAYDNMAAEYLKIKKNGDAFNYSTKALKYYIKADAKSEAALCCKNISDYYIAVADSLLRSNKREEAYNYYKQAQTILGDGSIYAKESQDRFSLVNILINTGYLNEKFGNNKKAIINYQDAISHSKEMGLNKELAGVYKSLANLYSEVNDKAKAFQYLKMCMEINDSISSKENAEIIANLSTQYDTEKKEQQIIMLENEKQVKRIIEKQENQKKNFAYIIILALLILGYYIFVLYSKRKKLSNQLSQSLIDLKSTQQQLIQTEREKEAENIRLRISRDIHDDIGHSLTKISLLSDMTASDKQINSPEAIETLGRISDYSRNVNSSLSEIVWAISPTHDSLDSLIVYMRNHIHKFFENTGITYQINFPDAYENRSINPELKRNIFLVLKESLNNILKYAKAKNVTVDFKIDGDKFELKIKDNGVGFAPLSFGEEPGVRSGGNGLPNMKHRIEQTGGNFEINSSPNAGCEIFANGILL
ncbi:MAG: sensor histidine kinase [Bacteroidetes bacterium]|nr:sensor histidine kinase [Bacteroidota bacterium]